MHLDLLKAGRVSIGRHAVRSPLDVGSLPRSSHNGWPVSTAPVWHHKQLRAASRTVAPQLCAAGGGGGCSLPVYGCSWDDDEGSGPEELFLPVTWVFTIWNTYLRMLDLHPIMVKSLTAATVGALGDVLSQLRGSSKPLDPTRILAVAVDGMLVSGPCLHLGYGALERYLPCSNGRSVRNALVQVAIDECILDPLFVGSFFFTTGIVERQQLWTETIPNLRRQYLPTLRGAWLASAAFIPVQYYSFRYLPVHTRVLVVNCCDMVWYAAVSFGRHKKHGEELRQG